MNDTLVQKLAVILHDDQAYRQQRDSVQKRFGSDSRELVELYKKMKDVDSVNLIKVLAIIDKYGWPGADIIGQQGNTILFLVLQHASLEIQEKYLATLKEAVHNGRAKAKNLALLEDRIALGEGRKQIYGSQIGWNTKTNEYFIFPVSDPDNLDKRREEMGLQPMVEYASKWQIIWDPGQYKKDLPRIELMLKERN